MPAVNRKKLGKMKIAHLQKTMSCLWRFYAWQHWLGPAHWGHENSGPWFGRRWRLPQWNCNCRNCAGVRDGSVQATPRTQSSIAVSANGVDWVLFNASPDILSQFRAHPALQPGRSLRDTGIVGVVLMDAQIDHTTGLFMLREGKPLDVWCYRAGA
jgi:hypothetical protein